MADPNLSITIHLERLQSIKAPATDFYFGLNLSTALHNADGSIPLWDGHPPDYDRLCPWRWTDLKPRVWVWKRGDPLASASEVLGATLEDEWTIVPELGDDHLLDFVWKRADKLTDTAENPLTKQQNPFYWSSEQTIGDGTKSEEFVYDETADVDLGPGQFFKWLPFMQGISKLPQPVPQQLSLSHLVRITSQQFIAAGIADPTADVFAVFVCFDATIKAVHTDFTTAPKSLSPALEWPVSPGNERLPEENAFKLNAAGAGATVFTQPVVFGKPALGSKPPIDMTTLWVGLEVDADGLDWASQAVPNVTDAFDPAQHLVEILRKVISLDPKPGEPNAQTLEAMGLARAGVVALSRELAHCDSSRGDGRSLVDRVGARLLPGARIALEKAIADYDAKLAANVGKAMWDDVLRAASPQLKGILDSGALQGTQALPLLSTLDIFTAQLADPAVLNALVTVQWQEACILAQTPSWNIIAPLLAEELQRRSIRRELQKAWMSGQKSAIVPKLKDQATFVAGVPEVLHDAVKARLWAATILFPPKFDPASTDLITAMVRQAVSAPGGGSASNDRLSGVEDAHPVLFLVDNPDQDDSVQGDVASDNDLQRRLAGVGILLRKKAGGQKWHCLHMARVVETDPVAKPPQPLVTEAVIRPSSLAHVDGQRQVSLAYDNQLLGAKNPIAAAAMKTQQVDVEEMMNGWLTYEVPDATASLDEYQTPALIFGQRYQAAAFLVTNSGQLPAELIDDSSGSKLKRKKVPFDPANTVPPVVEEFTYQRRTRIGAPRFDRTEGSSGPGSGPLPPLPEGVRPLASEVTDPHSAKKAALVSDQGPPLLLVGPKEHTLPNGTKIDLRFQESFEFKLRRPATPYKVWERWQKKAEPLLTDDHFGLMHGGILSLQDTGSDADFTLDDPATEKALCVTVQKVHGTGGPGKLKHYRLEVSPTAPIPATCDTWEDFTQLLASQRAKSLNFIVKMDAGAAASGFDPATRTLTVKPGEIWRFTASAVVRADLFGADKPMAEVVKAAMTAELDDMFQPGGATTRYAFAPYELIVECASVKLPAPDELWQALALDFKMPEQQLLVQLDRTKMVDGTTHLSKPEWASIGDIQLQRQRWKWHARPTAPPPAIVKDDADNARWDVNAYTLRDDEDHKREQIPLTFEEGAAEPWREIMRLPLAEDTRCIHFRWSMNVVSRYSPKITCQAQSNDKNLGRWKRVLVKCRHQASSVPVAPPPLKLMLPVTDSWMGDEVADSPGLLCVFHDEWYEKHGLAERLVAGIRTVRFPNSDEWYLQYGSDPVLHKHGLPPLEKVRTSKMVDDKNQELTDERIYLLDQPGLIHKPGQQTIEPPMGHTFDRLTVTTPGVQNTSFVLRMPTIPQTHLRGGTGNERPEGWRFVQLRFQRQLAKEHCEEGEMMASTWTSPQWVQLLHSRTAMLPEDGLNLLDSNRKFTLVKKAQGWQVNEAAKALGAPRIFTHRTKQPGEKRFACWLVITRAIFDTSRQEGEAYVETLQMNPTAQGYYVGGNLTLPSGTRVFARWVEVQTRDHADLESYLGVVKDPWLALFPSNPKQDAVARVTNVSPRLSLYVA